MIIGLLNNYKVLMYGEQNMTKNKLKKAWLVYDFEPKKDGGLKQLLSKKLHNLMNILPEPSFNWSLFLLPSFSQFLGRKKPLRYLSISARLPSKPPGWKRSRPNLYSAACSHTVRRINIQTTSDLWAKTLSGQTLTSRRTLIAIHEWESGDMLELPQRRDSGGENIHHTIG